MNDHQIDLALEAMGRDRTGVPEPPTLRERMAAIPFTTSRRRGWLSLIDTRGYTMFSAVKFIAAGVIVALFGGLAIAGVLTTQQDGELLPAAVTESASPTTSAADALPLVTEEVEPGVERIVSDGVGHDLDETHRYYMEGIALAADGTLWLSSLDEANSGGALVWALGQPGVYGVEQGVPEDGGFLAPLHDGSLLIVADDVVRLDGETFVPDDGPAYRPMPGRSRTLWLIEPDDMMGLVPEGESVARPRSVLPAVWTGFDWLSPEAFARVYTDGRDTWCGTSGVGVTCEDPRGNVTAYLADTPINQLVMTSDRSVWAVGGYDGGPGGLYRITLPPVE